MISKSKWLNLRVDGWIFDCSQNRIENIDLAPGALEEHLPLRGILSDPQPLQTLHQVVCVLASANKLCELLMLRLLLALTLAFTPAKVL